MNTTILKLTTILA
jgi:carbonic anhydrase